MKTLTIIFALMLVGCAADPNRGRNPGDVRREAEQRAHPVTPEIQATRDKLAQDYRALLAQLFPNFNGIEVRFLPNVYGPEWGFLVADHSMFTPYTFDIGPAGPAVKNWIAEHYAEIQRARITLVGVGGGASYTTGVTPPFTTGVMPPQ